MKHQAVFNKVKRHLLSQKKKSINQQDNCAYRGPDGLKCAIGALIKDKYYSSDLEDRSVFDNNVLNMLHKSGVDKFVSVNFLNDLQYIHDDTPLSKWKKALKEFAIEHDLKP